MDRAVDNYLAISAVLREDSLQILENRDDSSAIWRRQFIRTIIPHIDGLIYSIAEMCKANPSHEDLQLSSGEKNVLSGKRCSAEDSYKNTLKLAYKKFRLEPLPNFGVGNWEKVKFLFSVRDRIMHPKNPASLAIVDDEWTRIQDGAVWALQQIFLFDGLLGQQNGIELPSLSD